MLMTGVRPQYRFLIRLNLSALLVLVVVWILYALFGHRLVAAMYHGNAFGFLNAFIKGQQTHPLADYLREADKKMWLATAAVVLLSGLFSALHLLIGAFPSLKLALLPDAAPARRRQVAFLLGLSLCYVVFLLVFRWMRYPLFNPSFGVLNMWPLGAQGSLLEAGYLVFMICLPAAMWASLLYFGFRPVARFVPPVAVALLVVAALAVVDLDMWWYEISHQHGTTREVVLLLTANVQENWGVAPWQIGFYRARIAKDGLVIALLWMASGVLAHLLKPGRGFRVRATHLGLVLLAVVLADTLVVGYMRSKDKAQWLDLSTRDPFRLGVLDRLAADLIARDQDLKLANAALLGLRQSRPDSIAPGLPSRLGAGRQPSTDNVLLLVVEGFNVNFTDSTTMPFWSEFARRSTLLQRHYSTGNFTEYGVLGLLWGSPPVFYRNSQLRTPAAPLAKENTGSPYLEVFRKHGYRTRIVAKVRSEWFGEYLGRFTEPDLEPGTDWELIPGVLEELARSGPHLVYTHYWGTHWPYLHAPSYTKFLPEVPEKFDYGAGNARDHRVEIVNRYRNCLVELDAWLRAVIGGVDLQRTIVVVTGDHGEEMFEHGRLAHTSSLDYPQIRTPFLMYVPGLPGLVVDEVTSHADVMPSLLDVPGWSDQV
ncbi:MAG TPA: sulfatase-like hydrolase/transferase, partial [Gemmatimonadales bacterium]|nr:sulfatase-like hydrolase/transferase [Gemmatimonadales bacterium]